MSKVQYGMPDRPTLMPAAICSRRFDQRVSRFKVEALAAAKLQHPHIVHVLSAGHSDGYRYIAMDLIAGANLAEIIEALRGGSAEHPQT